VAVTGRYEEFELELTEKQRELIRRLTGHERDKVNLTARDGRIDPEPYGPVTGPLTGPYRVSLSAEQSAHLREVCGQDIAMLFFDVVGTEPVFSSIPSAGFPICYPKPSITTCEDKPPDTPPNDRCAATEVFRETGRPLLDRFIPVHLRNFRDGILRRTNFGGDIIDAYYEYSNEISEILRSHPEWLVEAREVILRNSAQIRALTLTATLPEWTPLSLNIYTSQRDVDEALNLLMRIGDQGRPGLVSALRPVFDLVSQFGDKTTSEILAIFDASE
jgi:hypothetical protein